MAVLVPLFSVAVLPTQIQTLVCRFSGVVMAAEVCCPSAPQALPRAEAALKGETCCLVKTVDLPRLLSERALDLAGPQSPQQAWRALAVAVPSSGVSAGDLSASAVGSRAVRPPEDPPARGPSIVLAKRAFLI